MRSQSAQTSPEHLFCTIRGAVVTRGFAAPIGGSARFAQVEGRSHYVSGRGRSPGSRLWMSLMSGPCEAHQARISWTCRGVETVSQGIRLRDAR
jgi:hypothetical protein